MELLTLADGCGGSCREGIVCGTREGGGGTVTDDVDEADAAASSDSMELMEARESIECSLPQDSLRAFLTAGLLRYVRTAGRP